MPIYEYRCGACGHELEAIQKMSEDPLTDCPACGAPALKKKISAVAFRLKGGGWYETDFKTGGKKKNLAKDDASASSAASDSGKSGGDKADSGKSGKDSGGATKDTTSSSSSSSSSNSTATA
ncbi:MAG: zinc ribbon domain-containing protein [Gammaproteobacteria bacterium]|nr:zinc ribbon domain-containing protein [Gammaproteobacteria bacterium]MCP5424044.1 zinc ribbon domain-containing protein [Gammaproteobacteria bacterium]MCP5459522.1 zinc ribbon domain-containing protein [Gammaproteobacteria bacterium]